MSAHRVIDDRRPRLPKRLIGAAALALALLAGAFLYVQPSGSDTAARLTADAPAELQIPSGLSLDQLHQLCVDRLAQGTKGMSTNAKAWLTNCVGATVAGPSGSPTPTPPGPTATPTPTTSPTGTPSPTGSPTGTPTPSPTGTPPPANGQFTPAYWSQWSAGPPASASYVPLAVWDQNPERERNGITNAINYRNAGINTFIGNFGAPDGNSQARLTLVQSAGMQYWMDAGSPGDAATELGLSSTTRSAMMLGDEQDMQGVNVAQFSANAAAVGAADPSRPTYNNWGKCFSLYPWWCDGLATGGQTMQQALMQLCSNVDVVSSDYYPATDGYEPADEHTPAFYGAGVRNTLSLCGGGTRPVLGFIETGHPGGDSEESWPGFSDASGILPSTVVAGVWSELANGANGIIYFVHDFNAGGGFTEDGLFDHPATLAAVAAMNQQIQSMATMLNAPRQLTGLTVTGADATLRRNAQGSYVIAASTSPGVSTVGITVAGWAGKTVTVVGEGRTVTADASGHFSDSTAAWGHHVYAAA